VYVITIKDSNKWVSESNFNREKEYDRLTDFYKTEFNMNHVEAQENALLKLYGDVINLYRAPRSNNRFTISDYKNLKLDENGKVVENPC